MTQETNRRSFTAMLAASGAGIFAIGKSHAHSATPESHSHDHGHDESDHAHDHNESDHEHNGSSAYLLVGDSETETLTVYNATDYSVIETIDGVVMNSHAGTIPLADGSVLLVDDAASRLLHIEVHGNHLHIHETSVPGQVAHIAVDSDHAHYCAVGTSSDDEYQLHLVDLETWDVVSLEIPDAGEVGLMMTHDHLFHRNSNLNRVEAYNVSDLRDGNVSLLSHLDIGTFGHGEAINEETGELFMLTDDGVDIAYWNEPNLEFGKTLDWPGNDAPGRGYFCRLINDGRHLLTYTSDRSAPETEWTTWINRVVIYDIVTDETIITPLPDGYTFRYSLADNMAMFTVIGASGDEAIAVDIDPESETFGQAISTTSLESMTGGSAAGDAFYERGAYRAAAVLPGGETGFISRGGDGVVDVINPLRGEIISTIPHSSPLSGGGTLAVFGSAIPFADTIGR